jgi:hypothetical protein
MEPVEPRIANFFTFFIFADWVGLLAGETALDGIGVGLDCRHLKRRLELYG